MRDLTEALEKEAEGGTIGQEQSEVDAESSAPIVNDISSLVKKSAIPAELDLKRKADIEGEPFVKKSK